MMLRLRRFFKRSAKSTLEKLEEIENSILDLESMRTSRIDTEKRFVFRLLLYSFIFFGIAFIFFYYYYWPSTQIGKVMFWSSLLVYPSIVSGLKWGFHAFFLRSISRADERLKLLREEKQHLLEEVMENETFNKAQQILKRFDPLMFARLTAVERTPSETPKIELASTAQSRSSLACKPTRHADGDNYLGSAQTPFPAAQSKGSNGLELLSPVRRPPINQPRLLRPILPRNRSLVDKLLDALVGDGPDKRYALICDDCAAHNGMALKEEFEFLAFRCCYCSHFNPPKRARLKTPVPPNVACASKRSASPSADEGVSYTDSSHGNAYNSASSSERSPTPSPVPLPNLIQPAEDTQQTQTAIGESSHAEENA